MVTVSFLIGWSQSLKLANLKRINTKEMRGKWTRPMLQAKFLECREVGEI